jgi:hypothetical protein
MTGQISLVSNTGTGVAGYPVWKMHEYIMLLSVVAKRNSVPSLFQQAATIRPVRTEKLRDTPVQAVPNSHLPVVDGSGEK